ncbi:MAG: ComEC/Rec2 family competence protein [Mycoplasma sp.]|nr:ComEC/Rec2 family competence protein [Mycoplasma sp.]
MINSIKLNLSKDIINIKKNAKYLLGLNSYLLSVILFVTFLIKENWIFLVISFILSIVGLLSKPKLFFLLILVPVFILIKTLSIKTLEIGFVNKNYQIRNIIKMGIIVKNHNNFILIKTRKEIYNIGDVVSISGKIEKVKNNSDFDLKEYLLSKKVTGIINRAKINEIEKSNSLVSKLNRFVNSKNDEYKKYVNLLLLGNKIRENKNIFENFTSLGIVHLFVISGFHISLFFNIIKSLLKIAKIKNEVILDLIPLLPLGFYIVVLNFPISAMRALIFTILLLTNKHILKNKFTSLEILLFTATLLLIYNFHWAYSFSFIFTFIATGAILIINQLENISTFKKAIYSLLFIYMSTFLIFIKINQFFNFFAFFNSIIFGPIISLLYTITLFLFPFRAITNNIFTNFDKIITTYKNINPIITFTIKSNSLIIVQIFTIIHLISPIKPKIIFPINILIFQSFILYNVI